MIMEEYEIRHIKRLRELAPECAVLLKSDGSFPLAAPCEIALYGSGARNTIKGGTGSGDVNVRSFTSCEEGLKNAGFTITSENWLDGYDNLRRKAWDSYAASLRNRVLTEGLAAVILAVSGAAMTEPDYDLPIDAPGDTAIYVLARQSGEGADRKSEKGDIYLNDTEIRDILAAQKRYKNFLLVLNVGGVVDLSPIANDVKNILLLSQLGMTTGDTLADIILGKKYPSGKLTTTWAAAEDYCSVGSFGDKDDTEYREGIYIGYRYFDTVGIHPLFPFGFGLGYTKFRVTLKEVYIYGHSAVVEAAVKNIGSRAGRETVQLYISAPGKKIDMPFQSLAAFAKTEELKPDEEETVRLTFDLTALAYYDSAQSRMVIESGSHILRLGTSSEDAVPAAVLHTDDDIRGPILSHVGGNPYWQDWLSESRHTDSVPAGLLTIEFSAENVRFDIPMTHEISAEAVRTAKSLTTDELVCLCTGAFTGDGSQSVIGNAGFAVAGAAGETVSFKKHNIPAIVMADGPAGLRLSRLAGHDEQGVYAIKDEKTIAEMKALLPEQLQEILDIGKAIPDGRGGEVFEQNCTAIPIGTAIAQSWNPIVAERCGDIVGDEMERFGVNIWLAPALNIHRSIRCGRNFEYYSEDPLLSGKIAAGITRGAQSHPGRGVTVKHFVCNNQETNRFRSNSMVSERALREIYLRGFETVIKEAQPAAVMTSYNLLNGEHTSQRHDLCETVLREEWGFKGFVMSDWVAGSFPGDYKYPAAVASGAVRAGNDIMMPGTKAHYDDIKASIDNPEADYPLSRELLERCAARMIEAARNLAAYGKDQGK